jgi:hypothetical protein
VNKTQVSVYLTEQELALVRKASGVLFQAFSEERVSLSCTLALCAVRGAQRVLELFTQETLVLPPSGHGPERPRHNEGIPCACWSCGTYYRLEEGKSTHDLCAKCLKQMEDDIPY